MRRRGGQGKGDEIVSTGCELHCVLRLGCRGPFVLSGGGGGQTYWHQAYIYMT